MELLMIDPAQHERIPATPLALPAHPAPQIGRWNAVAAPQTSLDLLAVAQHELEQACRLATNPPRPRLLGHPVRDTLIYIGTQTTQLLGTVVAANDVPGVTRDHARHAILMLTEGLDALRQLPVADDPGAPGMQRVAEQLTTTLASVRMAIATAINEP